MTPKPLFKGLYAIIDDEIHKTYGLKKLIVEVSQSSIQIVQLRLKNSSLAQKIDYLDEFLKIETQPTPFVLINDDISLLNHPAVSGAHLGQTDTPLRDVRKRYPNACFGLSVHNAKELQLALEEGADYVGIGALFQTHSKSNTTPISLEALNTLIQSASVPVVGIGGINRSNMLSALEAGCQMVAMISGLIEQHQFVGQALHETLLKNK